MGFGVNSNLEGVSFTFSGGLVTFHFGGQTISILSHTEGITLGKVEEIHKISGIVSVIYLNGIGKVGDRINIGQASGCIGPDLQRDILQG